MVGASGAGKSTVFNILLRLYDLSGGGVFIDGHNLRDLGPQALRANMALVSQDAVLFDDTVRANIGLGRSGASEEEIAAAARAANAAEFIAGLPGGLDAPVGEAGSPDRRMAGGGAYSRLARLQLS